MRTDGGQEGWIEERSLVPQDVYDAFQKLASDAAGQQVQAHGTARSELNMHMTPSREGEHLYQLKDGEKVEVLKRATAEKNPPKPAPANVTQTPKGAAAAQPQSKTAPVQTAAPAKAAPDKAAAARPPDAPKPVMEDWYLVRNSAGHVGWVLLRMIDLDVPLEIAQYAEGQRIMGYFVLNTVLGGRQAGAAVSGAVERTQGRTALGL